MIKIPRTSKNEKNLEHARSPKEEAYGIVESESKARGFLAVNLAPPLF